MSAPRPDRRDPHRGEHEASLSRRMAGGTMPRSLPALLRWFEEGWTPEVPRRIHAAGAWVGSQERDRRTGEPQWTAELVGGSHLGTPRHADPFRRYVIEARASDVDEDGYFVRPMHAALGRLATRDHWMARSLLAVAHAGFDWRAVADRGGWREVPEGAEHVAPPTYGGWPHGMFSVYLEESLRRLWREHSEQVLRLA